MPVHVASSFWKNARNQRRKQRGIALITALLLLLIVTGMSVAMVMAFNSDMIVNGYYGNFRATFYSADAGMTVARQLMIQDLQNAVSSTYNFSSGSAPIPGGYESTVLSDLGNKFGSGTTVNTSVTRPEKFFINTGTASTTLAAYSTGSMPQFPTGTTVGLALEECDTTSTSGTTTQNVVSTSGGVATCSASASATDYKYIYYYFLTGVGQSASPAQATLTDQGSLIIDVNAQTTTNPKFSAWGTFIANMKLCDAELVGGTITGPQFTDGGWTFGSDQTYTFTDSVGQTQQNAGFYYGSSQNCYQANQNSYTNNHVTIQPTFEGPFNRGQNSISMPTNSYNQLQAIYDVSDANAAAQSQTDQNVTVYQSNLNGVVSNAAGAAYSCSGSSCSTTAVNSLASSGSGVYLPYTPSGSGSNLTGTFSNNGGGIFIQGDVDSITLAANGTSGETYTITQGTTTTTITVSPASCGSSGGCTTSGTTTVQSCTGSTCTTRTISGTPTDQAGANITGNYATLLYVNGKIKSLSGVVNNYTPLNITAYSDITVTGNITYTSEPVYTSGSNLGNLQTSNNYGQTLGLFTNNGSVILAPGGGTYNNPPNLEIDASLITSNTSYANNTCNSQNYCAGEINIQNNINTLTIVGGRIQNQSELLSESQLGTRNVIFDRRYASQNFAPPFFPGTTFTVTCSTSGCANITPTIQRVQWTSKYSYY
jgi:Tfp pilus assembly protein PilX